MQNLQKYLDSHRCNGNPTHTSMNPPGKYELTDDTLKKFLFSYAQSLRQHHIFSLTEISTSCFIPVIVDIDLKVEVKDDSLPLKLYNLKHVSDIVFCFLEVLKSILVDVSPSDLHCFLLERNGYISKKTTSENVFFKNGFHLHFPKIFLSRVQQEEILLPKVKEMMKLSNIDLPNGSTYDTIIDESIYRGKGKQWFMYGSTKTDAPKPYLCTGYFDEENKFHKDWKNYIQSEFTDKDNLELNILQFFSIQCTHKEDYIQQIHDTIHFHKETPTVQPVNEEEFVQDFSPDTEHLVDSLLPLLPDKFYNEYDLWINIGWILYNIFRGSSSGFHRWNEFSKQCPDKYSIEDVEDNWRKMYCKDYTIRSLKYLVRENNPEGYKNLEQQYLSNYCETSINQTTITHHDTASMLYSKYGDMFTCASIKPTVWFTFSGNIWKESDDGVHLRNCISTELVDKFIEMRNQLLQSEKGNFLKQKETLQKQLHRVESLYKTESDYLSSMSSNRTTEEEREYKTIVKKMEAFTKQKTELLVKIEDVQKECDNIENGNSSMENKDLKKNDKLMKINRIITNLKSSPFKKNVMTEANDLFLNENFIDKINTNAWLVAFNNGVYDLKTNEFRKGKPDDYLSVKMDVNYREDFTIDSPPVQLAVRFFEQIFPDETVRNYFLEIQSEIWIGRNKEKIFQIWTGEGDNGKSVTQDIFEKMLGPLCRILPSSTITGKRTQSSGASPELERTGNGVRLVVVQETTQDEVINIGILKELSGNDKFYARGLHKNPRDIQPMFKIVMICNKPPQITNTTHDPATWNRIRVIPFESYFPRNDDEVPPTYEEQVKKKIFPRDQNFADKVPDMLEGVVFYLLHIYRQRQGKPIQTPDKVMLCTNNYRQYNDHFREFIDDRIKIQENSSVTLTNVYNAFKEWYRECYAKQTVPPKKELKDYLYRMWGTPVCNKWSDLVIEYEDE